MTATDPMRYLTCADDLLRGDGDLGAAAVAGGWWPKACACLIRLALEAAVTGYWHQVSPPVARYGNGRTKLLLLRRHLPKELVRQASFAWAALSRATHHHCYESSVSAVELRRLHAAAARIARELTSHAPSAPGSPTAGTTPTAAGPLAGDTG